MDDIATLFLERGGKFHISVNELVERYSQVKAFLFDWDGVFNSGWKGGNASSGFSEIDSMGTNLMRFGKYLESNGQVPITAILTGADNQAAYDLAGREHFNQVYFKVPNKTLAWKHFLELNSLKAEEVAFFYDDVLDIPVAREAGVKIFIHSSSKILFAEYVRSKHLAHYETGGSGEEHGVRESCELLMGLSGRHQEIFDNRIAFSDSYANYLGQRNSQLTTLYSMNKEGAVAEHHVI
ncbi:phosphatase [bacterium SCSIO 12741]|nr:phosphatase [bacterium SCSIO 12741]